MQKAKTDKTPVFPIRTGKTGVFCLCSVRLIYLQLFPSISVDDLGALGALVAEGEKALLIYV